MRRGLILLTLLLAFHQLNAQNTLLPIAKSGKWGLVDTAGKFVLEAKYDYIEFNAQSNEFIYHLNGKQGTLSNEGESSYKPIYTEIKLLQGKWAATRIGKKWGLNFQKNTVFKEEYDSIKMAGYNLFLLFKKEHTILYNPELKKQFKGSFSGVHENMNTIKVSNYEGNKIVLNKLNLNPLLVNIDSLIHLSINYEAAVRNDSSFIIDKAEASVVWVTEGAVSYWDNGRILGEKSSLLFNADEREAYSVPKFDEILSMKFPNLRYRSKGLVGIWDLKNETHIIPAHYERIAKVGRYWFVDNFEKHGVFSAAGKVLVPVDFESVDLYPQGFKVESENLFGLFSLSGKILEKTVYKKIRLYDNSITCLNENELVLLSTDASGKVLSRKKFKDFMSFSIKKESKPIQRSIGVSFRDSASRNTIKDGQEIGWYRPIIIKTVNGIMKKSWGKWGLKDTASKVLIPPRYGSISIYSDLQFTKCYMKDLNRKRVQKISLYGISPDLAHTAVNSTPSFTLINQKTGRPICKNVFVHINDEDLRTRTLTRAYTRGPVLINKQCEVVWNNLTYFSGYEDGIITICEGGTVSFKNFKTGLIGEQFPKFLARVGIYSWPGDQYQIIKKGAWYFINSEGKQLNNKPFEYAKSFKKGRAIVQVKQKWGVVDTAMNFVIPAKYDLIEQIDVNDSVYFKLSVKTNENYLYNRTNGNLEQTELECFSNYQSGIWHFRNRANSYWGLMDTSFNIIAKPIYTKIYPFENELAQVIYKSKRSVINMQGQTIIPFYRSRKIRPIHDLFAIRTKKGEMLVNEKSDTILSEYNCKEVIDLNTNYVLFVNINKQKKIYSRIIKETIGKNYVILSVSLDDHLALIKKGGKKKLLDLKANKLLSTKVQDVVKLTKNAMIYRNTKNLFGYMSLERDTITLPIYTKAEGFKNGWAIAKGEKFYKVVYREKKIKNNFNITKMQPLGDAFLVYGYGGKGILSKEGDIILDHKNVAIELLNNSFYKVTDGKRKKYLYDLEGNKITNNAYDDFKAVSKSGIVAKVGNFDYLYTSFINKSLSFQKMDPFSGQLFMLNEGYKVGLFSEGGKELIPIEYHKIDRLGSFWQIRFFNSFGFAKQNGDIINNPLSKN